MSFLGGAECSTAGNPLTQFTKHVQDDKSLQRDRLVGRGPGGMQESMRSAGMMGGQDQVREISRQFPDGNSVGLANMAQFSADDGRVYAAARAVTRCCATAVCDGTHEA